MDTRQYKDFKIFITRCLVGNVDETGKVRRFVINHLTSKGAMGGGVGFVAVEPDATIDDVDNIINEVEMMVNADADGVGSEQRYVIKPTFNNVNFTSESRFILRVPVTALAALEASEGLGPEERSDEGANLAMFSANLMRHNENIMRLTVTQPAQLLTAAQKTISRQQDTITDLHEKLIEQSGERLKIYSIMEDMLSKRQERELAAEQAKQKMEIVAQMGGQLMQLAPMVVNKISGKNVFPQASTPAEMLLKEWLKSVTKEQFEAMLRPLTPQQQFPLLMMYQEFLKQAEEEEANKKAKESVNKSPDPSPSEE